MAWPGCLVERAMPKRTAPVQDAHFDAFRLAREHGTLEGQVDLNDLPRLAEWLADEPEDGDAPLAWRITGGEDAQRRPALSIRLEGVVPLVCQRCLGPLPWPVAQRTEILLARSDAEMAQLDADSGSEVIVAAAPLDPAVLVEDELLLTVPYAPRHAEACSPPAGT